MIGSSQSRCMPHAARACHMHPVLDYAPACVALSSVSRLCLVPAPRGNRCWVLDASGAHLVLVAATAEHQHAATRPPTHTSASHSLVARHGEGAGAAAAPAASDRASSSLPAISHQLPLGCVIRLAGVAGGCASSGRSGSGPGAPASGGHAHTAAPAAAPDCSPFAGEPLGLPLELWPQLRGQLLQVLCGGQGGLGSGPLVPLAVPLSSCGRLVGALTLMHRARPLTGSSFAGGVVASAVELASVGSSLFASHSTAATGAAGAAPRMLEAEQAASAHAPALALEGLGVTFADSVLATPQELAHARQVGRLWPWRAGRLLCYAGPTQAHCSQVR